MNLLIRLLLVAIAVTFPVAVVAQDVEVGTGLICDTQAQVERFVSDFNGNPDAAITAINGESPNACGVVSVAFVRGQEVSTVRNAQGTFKVTEILVVGVVTPMGFQAVPPLPQFTIFLTKEENA